MKLKFNFIENYLELEETNIVNIECENKNYFYRIVEILNDLSLGNLNDNVIIYNDLEEIDLSNKVQVFIDYFNIKFDNKKYQNKILSLLQEKIDDENLIKINNNLNKINKIFASKLGQIDIPLVMDEIEIDKIYKQLKFNISIKNNLLENLFIIIDVERIFNINKLLVFVNLKQYLTKKELEEFYKYAIYNQIKILLIDSQAYGISQKYEKKLLIDIDLVEFML